MFNILVWQVWTKWKRWSRSIHSHTHTQSFVNDYCSSSLWLTLFFCFSKWNEWIEFHLEKNKWIIRWSLHINIVWMFVLFHTSFHSSFFSIYFTCVVVILSVSNYQMISHIVTQGKSNQSIMKKIRSSIHKWMMEWF